MSAENPVKCTPVEYGAVTVLTAPNGGAYPYGNSLLVRGNDATLLVDPSLTLASPPPGTDAVFVSHAHEDHLVGLGSFDMPVFTHLDDLGSVHSRDVLMDGYGLPPTARQAFERNLAEKFGVCSRPDAHGVGDGHRFDLGGRTATVVHLPGHTAGHCGLLVEPDGFFFVSDIDLTSFGPNYGDPGGSLSAFLQSIERCASIEARWYGTFHQKGVIEGADNFLEQLRRYRDVIVDRDRRLLEFLIVPRTVDEIASHRLVYRPHVDEPYVGPIEKRTAQRHVARLLELGAIAREEPGVYRAVGT